MSSIDYKGNGYVHDVDLLRARPHVVHQTLTQRGVG